MPITTPRARRHAAAGPAPAPRRSTPDPDEWLPSAPFRAHLRHLVDTTGLDHREVARLAGVPELTARRLMAPQLRRRDRIRRCDAEALYLLTPELLQGLAHSPRRLSSMTMVQDPRAA